MNTPEKIAATYLRLNGFLLLQHFTIFTDRYPNHVDLIGYRAGGSEEVVSGIPLKPDDEFFEYVKGLRKEICKASPIGIIVQVSANTRKLPKFHRGHESYVKKFFGEKIKPVRIIFQDQQNKFDKQGATKMSVCISLKHSFEWIQRRIQDVKPPKFYKEGSWELSEEFLADILLLHRLGVLKSPPDSDGE